MKRNKYLVISPNGYGNVGDDICAYAGKEAILLADPSAKIVISSPPMDQGLVEWADYVILSGGGIIYDRSEPNVDNYMSYIDLAHTLGKKSAVLGVGVQGIVTEKGKKRYIKSLNKCEFVSVRTEEDKQMLADIGFNSSVATFDIAYFIPRMIDKYKRNLLHTFDLYMFRRKLQESTKPKVGIVMINLKALKRDNYGGPYKQFDDMVELFIKENQETYDFYLMQHASEDGALMKEITDKYPNATFVPYKDIDDIPRLFELYSSLSFMLGVRLHSIALGLIADIPVVGVGSKGVKQHRLAQYGLPTLKEQFFTFELMSQLKKKLNSIQKNKILPLKTLSKTEKHFIIERNQINVDLITKMINS